MSLELDAENSKMLSVALKRKAASMVLENFFTSLDWCAAIHENDRKANKELSLVFFPVSLAGLLFL